MSSKILKFSNFFLLGASNLIGWNVVLTSLDYFSTKFSHYNCDFLMIIPCDIGSLLANIIIGYFIVWFSMNRRIVISLILLCLCILALPIEAFLFPNSLGFWIFMVLNFFISIFMVFLQGSIIGLAGNQPEYCMAAINFGFSVSGILVCLLRIICLWTLKNDGETGFESIFMYYSFSIFMVLLSVVIFARFIKKENEQKKDKNENEKGLLNQMANEEAITNEELPVNSYLEGREGTYKFLIKSMKTTMPYSFLMFFINLEFFFLFPGVALGYRTFPTTQAWNEVLVLLIFNSFDALGRYLSLIKVFYSKKSLLIVTLLRTVFIFTFLALFENWNIDFMQNTTFSTINHIVFALSNGYFITALFILASEVYENPKEKELVGFMMSFMMNSGGIVGSLLALPLATLNP